MYPFLKWNLKKGLSLLCVGNRSQYLYLKGSIIWRCVPFSNYIDITGSLYVKLSQITPDMFLGVSEQDHDDEGIPSDTTSSWLYISLQSKGTFFF